MAGPSMRLGQGRRRGALEVVGGDVDGWLELDSVRRKQKRRQERRLGEQRLHPAGIPGANRAEQATERCCREIGTIAEGPVRAS